MTPDETIPTIRAACPAFSKDVDLTEGPYSILGEFAIYLRDGITNHTISPHEIDRAFSVLNDMGSSSDAEVQNQLVVGVLEILTDNDDVIEFAKNKLEQSALDLFQRVLIGWNHA
jgi:hypothetical protein